MRDFDDAALEARLRDVLKERLGALPLDLTVEALDRRREAKEADRRIGRGRGVTLSTDPDDQSRDHPGRLADRAVARVRLR